MSLYYQTGEEIRTGDRIRLASDEGLVEFIVDPAIPNPTPEITWFLDEHGKGVMLSTTQLGSVYTSAENDELYFVGRDPSASSNPTNG